MMSLKLNKTSHDNVKKTILDHLWLAVSLVQVYNDSVTSAGGPAAAKLELESVTYPQLNALSCDQSPTVKVQLAERDKVSSMDMYHVFNFCARYGPQVLRAESIAWKSARTDQEGVPLLLEQAWLKKCADEVKSKAFMPDAKQIARLQADKPWCKGLPVLAEFLIQRLIYCRDTTAVRKKASQLQPDDPTYCHSAQDCSRVLDLACAVYMQYFKAMPLKA